MLSFLRTHRGLPVSFLILLLWAGAGLSALAVLLGRSAPGSATHSTPRRTPAPPLVGINYGGVSDTGAIPIILDPETGEVGPCALPDSEGLDLLGFSPW